MQIQRINCPQNFQGSVTAIGLSKSQEKVFNGLKDMLIKKVEDKDYLILHIDGSISSKYIAGDYSKEPKYVIMHTQVKPITRSTASAYTDSLNPNDWLILYKNLFHNILPTSSLLKLQVPVRLQTHDSSQSHNVTTTYSQTA